MTDKASPLVRLCSKKKIRDSIQTFRHCNTKGLDCCISAEVRGRLLSCAAHCSNHELGNNQPKKTYSVSQRSPSGRAKSFRLNILASVVLRRPPGVHRNSCSSLVVTIGPSVPLWLKPLAQVATFAQALEASVGVLLGLNCPSLLFS